MNPVLRALFVGTKDANSYLHGVPHDIIRKIWTQLVTIYKQNITQGVERTNPFSHSVAYAKDWPTPKGICINMMPFILGNADSIPKQYSQYWSLIKKCPIPVEELNKVGYLTIHESEVLPDTSQRRGGIHTESPGYFRLPCNVTCTYVNAGWGGGYYTRFHYHGGIYMASNIDNSCYVWDCSVSSEIIGGGGNIDHLREFLPVKMEEMKKGYIYWMTDKTPHEALPNLTGKKYYRQFFRVVTSEVSLWFSEHSTPNEWGIKPTAQIVDGNKFELY